MGRLRLETGAYAGLSKPNWLCGAGSGGTERQMAPASSSQLNLGLDVLEVDGLDPGLLHGPAEQVGPEVLLAMPAIESPAELLQVPRQPGPADAVERAVQPRAEVRDWRQLLLPVSDNYSCRLSRPG